jgi:hypothetical protein
MVCLARSDFEAALRLIDVTFDEGELASAILILRSDQFKHDFWRIDDVDLSNGFQGFVFELQVNRTLMHRIPRQEQPVNLPEKIYERKPAAGISILIRSIYIDYSMPTGYLSRLSCEGRLKKAFGAPTGQLDGSECSIEFRQYMRERDGLYPKEALSGTFVWYSTARSLSLELYYREADLTGPLAPLIFSSVSDVVRIQVTLLTDIAQLQLDDQHGEISFWSLHVYRKLGDAERKRSWW